MDRTPPARECGGNVLSATGWAFLADATDRRKAAALRRDQAPPLPAWSPVARHTIVRRETLCPARCRALPRRRFSTHPGRPPPWPASTARSAAAAETEDRRAAGGNLG